MVYATICSGIEAPTVAWEEFGWKLAWVSEIEPYCCHLLSCRYGASRPRTMPDPDEPGLTEKQVKARRAALKAVAKLPSEGRIPNYGDFTAIAELMLAGVVEAPDILIGGTPCQAFSIAGRRLSLADARGNLTLSFILLCDAIDTVRSRNGQPPLIVIWENVPGVLSTKDNAFGSFLAGIVAEDRPLRPPGGRWTDAGYVSGPGRAAAWRTFDAQFFGLAQRRERVFAVASAGTVCPAEILFESGGVRRDTPPGRETGESVAGTLSARTSAGGGLGTDFDLAGGLVPEMPMVSPTVTCKWAKGSGGPSGDECQNLVPVIFDPTQVTSPVNASNPQPGDPCHPLARSQQPPLLAVYPINTQMATRGPDTSNTSREGVGIGEEGDPAFTLQANHSHAVAFMAGQGAKAGSVASSEHVSPTLKSSNSGTNQVPTVAFQDRFRGDDGRGCDRPPNVKDGTTGALDTVKPWNVAGSMGVRRLMPTECEALQGFPRNYTLVPYRGRPSKDTPRYQSLGNSMAVKVVRWIGGRIFHALNPQP